MAIGSRPMIIIFAFLSALSPLAAQAKPEAANCSYDRNAMLQLDHFTFDQDDELGWRKLGDRRECRNEAAQLIDVYINRCLHQEPREGAIAKMVGTVVQMA